MTKRGLQTKFKKGEQSPGFLFWKVANLHQRLQREELKPFDLTPSQFSVLACYLYLQGIDEELPTQARLCKHASLDKMHVSDLTKALLKKGFLKKKTNPDDARSFRLEVTDTGSAICNQAIKAIESLDTRFFAMSGSTSQLHTLLTRISEQSEEV